MKVIRESSLVRFVQELQYIWQQYKVYEQFTLNDQSLAALDDLFARWPQYYWFRMHPMMPIYNNKGIRVGMPKVVSYRDSTRRK